MALFLLVGIALTSSLEARHEQQKQRGLEAIRGAVTTSERSLEFSFKIVLAAAQKNAGEAAAEAERVRQAQVAAEEKAKADYLATLKKAEAAAHEPIDYVIEQDAATGTSQPTGNYWADRIRQVAIESGHAGWADHLVAVALCESTFNPYADNGICKGLFQFDPGTWAGTPEGAAGASIWDGEAQIRMTIWMWEQGRQGEWACL
ncbi:MAG: hypothetical protein M1455_06490 [Actinobacteria bacterium]|nr:hypothetical protein [Actinomycetota bacterium]